MTAPTTSVAVSSVSAAGTASIDALVAGTKWNGAQGTGATLTFSFPQWTAGTPVFTGLAGAAYSTIGEPATSPRGLTAAQQSAVRAALQAWADVADVTFVEVPDTATDVGDLRFAVTAAEYSATAWMGLPGRWPSAADFWANASRGLGTSDDWTGGLFPVLLHEIGHGLGLGHPDEGAVRLDPAQTNWRWTVEASAALVTGNRYFDGAAYRYVQPDTPQLLDVAAIQYLYGANVSHRTGDDVYTFDPATPFFRTLWDAGGTDTISVANFTSGSTIDLRAGSFSSIRISSKLTAWGAVASQATYDGTDNLAIAYGATIENAIGGSGNDYLIGNAAANRLQGGAGDDLIEGLDGVDTAAYAGVRSEFTITRGAELIVQSDNEGRDVLARIERLQFAAGALALDLDGNAGTVARFLGAVFGRQAVQDPALVGIGLRFADSGLSGEQLMQLALDARLGAGASNAAVVDLLYTNVVGVAPAPDTAAYYAGLLAAGTYSQASLGVMAAETPENAAAIGLVGLSATGLAYVVA